MTALREHLAKELGGKLQRHGVVIWDDREAAYGAVVDDLVPDGTQVARFNGSWFDLRRSIENQLAGEVPPSMLVYVPADAPAPDPLEELRAVGAPFRSRLATVIRNALKGQLTEQRLEELGKQCQTLVEVEAALNAGAGDADARLVGLVGRSTSSGIAHELLTGRHDESMRNDGLADVVRTFFAQVLGVVPSDNDPLALRSDVYRHLLLTSIHAAAGKLPSELDHVYEAPSAGQRKVAADTLHALRNDPSAVDEIVSMAEAADSTLHTAAVLPWDEALLEVDPSAGVELVALLQAQDLLETGAWDQANELAATRLRRSWWAQPNRLAHNDFHLRWRVVAALCELNLAIDRPRPSLASAAAMLDWYETEGWKIDGAYRRCELLRVTARDHLDDFDEHFVAGRRRYEEWLDAVLRSSADALTADAQVPDARQQRHIHRREVAGHVETAYVLVDALRYELGCDLAARLGGLSAEVKIVGTVAAVPTITPIGMAAVTPGADLDYSVDLGPDDRLTVEVDGHSVRSVADRIKRFEHAHGTVADVPLDKLAQMSNKELRKRIEGSALVVVRSTEIDADGESDQLAASWGSFDSILEVLHTAVARLLHAGLRRVVITADHGFLAVRQVGDERKIDKPTGKGELHRRAWIGRGGTATASTVKLPLSDFGIGGDLDIVAPRGLGVFAAGGGLQFFHGGLSPQELIVPVITVSADEPTAEPKYEIQLTVAGGRIGTGVVAVTIQMTGDLFTRESGVRLVLSQDGRRVARVVGGDGYDPATETIDAAVDKSRVITMQISENLIAGSTATLEVLDATTGIRLGKAVDVEVAANVIVEDEL